MAFPTVAASTSGNSGANSTTHTIDIGSPTNGQRVLVLFAYDDAGGSVTASVTTPASGWTELFAISSNAAGRTGGYNAWYRDCDGTEGTSITVTTTGSEGSAYIRYTITAGTFDPATAPAVATHEGAASSTNPDPPLLNPAGWDVEDTLWFATAAWDGNRNRTGAPAAYPNNAHWDLWTNNGGQGIAAGTKNDAVASDDPTVYTIDGSDQWSTATIAIRPVVGGGTQYTESFTGGLSFSGAFAKQDRKPLSGTLSFSGALTKDMQKSLAGALSFAGNLAKETQRAFTGSLSFSGTLGTIRLIVREFTASLSFSGDLSKQAQKPFAGALSFAGNLVRETQKALSGGLSFSGTVAKQAQKPLAGSLSFSGLLTQSRVFLRDFTASLDFSGSLSRQVGKPLAGALSFTGALSRQAEKVLAGGLTFAGSLSRQTGKALVGALSFAGSMVEQYISGGGTMYFKEFTATLSFTGSLATQFIRGFAGDALNLKKAVIRRYPWNRQGLRKQK